MPAAILGGWLATEGALGAFVEPVCLAASAGKGSPLQLLLRPWVGPLQIPILVDSALAGIVLAIAAWLVVGFSQPGLSQRGVEQQSREEGVATFALHLLAPFGFALWKEPPIALAN